MSHQIITPTANSIAVTTPNLTTTVNGAAASLPLTQLPDYFSSAVTTATTPAGPTGGPADLGIKIRRDGMVGLGSDPVCWLSTRSLATKTVNHFGPALYVTTIEDHTIRFAQGCPESGVTFHAPATAPGQTMVIVNASNFVQRMSINAPQPIAGIGLQTVIQPGESITIQSFTTNWCVVDRSVINSLSKSVAIGTAFVDSIIALGELRFCYFGNVSLSNLGIQSTSNTPVTVNWWAHEQFALQATFNQTSGIQQSALAITAPTWLNCVTGGLGLNEILRYDVITLNSHYKVTLANFQDTRVHIAVEKSGIN